MDVHEILPSRDPTDGGSLAGRRLAVRRIPVHDGPLDAGPSWVRRSARVAGVMMLAGAGLNTYLVLARPESFAGLGTWIADVSPWHLGPFPHLWQATFAEHPRVWGTLVGVGFEAASGALALSRDPRRRTVGLTGITAFHAALLGVGLWLWAVPWLAVLVPATTVTARLVGRSAREVTEPDESLTPPRLTRLPGGPRRR